MLGLGLGAVKGVVEIRLNACRSRLFSVEFAPLNQTAAVMLAVAVPGLVPKRRVTPCINEVYSGFGGLTQTFCKQAFTE